MVVQHFVYNSAAQIARRALQSKPGHNGEPGEVIDIKLGFAASAVLAATIFAFIAGMGLITYATSVVTTLMMVESPPPPYELDTSYDPLINDPTNKNPNQPESVAVEVPVRRTKPVTYGIRSTIRHLQAQCGYFAAFRGIPYFLMMCLVTGAFSLLLSIPGWMLQSLFGKHLTSLLVMAAASGFAWRFSTVWTHFVISRPSSKTLSQRLPSRIFWRSVAPATALAGIASTLSAQVPLALMGRLEPPKGDNVSKTFMLNAGNVALSAFALSLLLQILFVVPSLITLTRIQASILPAEDEPVVPFDYSFGGRVISLEDGGSGIISFKDAWSSFSVSRSIRILWAIFKFSLIEMAFSFVFIAAIIGELIYFIPKDQRDELSNKFVEFVEKSS